MIEIYPSKLDGVSVQQLKLAQSVTFSRWVHHTKSILWQWFVEADRKSPGLPALLPVSVSVNDRAIGELEWISLKLQPEDAVVIVYEAKGSIVSGLFNAVSSVVTTVFKIFVKTPSIPTSSTYTQGDEIDKATFKANQAKLNDPIREVFGRNRIFPDYVVQTRKRYEGNEQFSYMHLCIGVGHFLINPAEVYIGNTPISSFGDDASVQIFPPGADVTGNEATKNFYSAPEVGNTSSGSAGLALTETFAVQTQADAASYQLSPAPEQEAGAVISIPDGAGAFPDGWTSGMELIIDADQDVIFGKGAPPQEDGQQVATEGTTTGDYFIGPVDNLDFDVGDSILITGDVSDSFICIGKMTVDGATWYYLAGSKDSKATGWIDAGTHSVMVQQPGTRYRITDTDASGTYNPDADDDDSSKDGDYTAPSRLTIELIDVDGNVDADWQGFDSRSSANFSITLTNDNSEGGWLGPFAGCPEGETTTKIEYDIYFQQGLNLVNEKGKNRTVIFHYDVQWRDMAAGGDWSTESRQVQGGSNDALEITDSVSFSSAIRPEFRMRKNGVTYPGDSKGTTYDDCEWSGLRAQLDRPSSYPGVTTMALRIRTGKRLAAQSENKVWCYATRMLPPYDDPDGDLVATRDIAPAMMYIARQRGYTNADVDMTELARLDAIWRGRGDYFDMEFSDETSVKDAINNALGVGYAEITNDYGMLKPWRDEKRTTFDHMYSPQNLTSELKIGFSSENKAASDTYDGLTVEFNNIATGQKDTVDCLLDGDTGEKMDTQTVYGITDRTRAYRWGMRQRAKQVYQDITLEGQTGFDALNSAYGDYVQLSGGYSDLDQSGVIYAYTIDNGKMTLSVGQPLAWAEGKQHILTLRGQDGRADGPYAAERGDNDDEVIINTPDILPNMDPTHDLTHFVFGVDARSSWGAIVQSVSPSGSPVGEQEPQVSLQAVIYDDRVYSYDNAYPDD